MLALSHSQRQFPTENLDPRLMAGLVGCWLGGGEGLTWFDKSGYGNHGALTNGAEWALGHRGGPALRFDGVNDYVALSRTPAIGTGNFTIACWVRNRATARGILFSCGDHGGGAWFGLEVNQNEGGPGTWGVRTYDGGVNGGFAHAPGLGTSEWQHLAFVAGSSNLADVSMYVGGVLKTTTHGPFSGPETISMPATFPWLAARSVSAAVNLPFLGDLSDVRFYSRALSAAEIALVASPSYSPIIPRR